MWTLSHEPYETQNPPDNQNKYCTYSWSNVLVHIAGNHFVKLVLMMRHVFIRYKCIFLITNVSLEILGNTVAPARMSNNGKREGGSERQEEKERNPFHIEFLVTNIFKQVNTVCCGHIFK